MQKTVGGMVIAAMLALPACSSRPREFTPRFAATPTDQQVVDRDVAACRALLAQGKLNSSGRLASGAAGVAAGATTTALGTAAATSAGLYGGGVALASATIVLLPFAMIGGAVGMAKMKRHRREVAIQRAMTGCLVERGYQVAGWTKAAKPVVVPAKPAG